MIRRFEPVENFQYKTSRYDFPPFHYEKSTRSDEPIKQ